MADFDEHSEIWYIWLIMSGYLSSDGMKSKSLFKLSLTANILLGLAILLFVFQTQLFHLFPTQEIPEKFESELVELGKEALDSEDVPVGALVTVDGKIVGRGHNTVIRDNNIAGHAEINAINDAIRIMGLQDFLGTNRENIAVYSTYEPCEMCKGTLNHYRIKQVKFMKNKSLLRWIKNQWAAMTYEFSKRKAGNDALQDSLFLLHPKFPGTE